MSAVKAQATATAQEIFYPSSDGEPMAETPIHIRALILLFQAMEDFLAALTDIYIAADMFWYWEEGNPQARRAPDLMVIKGVGRAERRSFFSWRENGVVPCLIVEIASENTWREDLYDKRQLYARLGVAEYFLFDPEAQYLRPALVGFRRNEQGVYVPLESDTEDRLKSEELGLYFRAEGAMLRLLDAATGQPVPTRSERLAQQNERFAEQSERLAQQNERLAEQNERLAQQNERLAQLDERIAQLEALLKQAKGQDE
jgi:Uma2 family endonuclease